MTELAKILILKGFDSEEVKDYFKSTFEQIKGKEVLLDHPEFDNSGNYIQTLNTVTITSIEDFQEKLVDTLDQVVGESIWSARGGANVDREERIMSEEEEG